MVDMITYKKTEAGKEVLEIVGDVFIIPNSLSSVKEFKKYDFQRHTLEKMQIAAAHAGISLEDDDKVVQLWMTCPECDNLLRHTIYVDHDGSTESINVHAFEHLPCKLFKGKKEGDVVDFFYSHKGFWRQDKPEEDIEITFHLKLNQSDYRYRSMGKFHEVLADLGYREV
ncbi:MAG: hypothetical protein NC548_13035 [Lachnospiraceae bacterium]|nr:hypothetical protein [Lachnospiraceae bacterium]MCM1230686.1 hypothetical protein [Ruminococcus flavefaciens]